MKLPKLFKKKKTEVTEELMLALDIGTEFVKAMLFTVDKVDVQVNVKGYGRAKQNSNAMQGAMIVNVENVVKTCDRAVGEALNQADKLLRKKDPKSEVMTPLPDKVIMSIAGELVQGVTIVADYEREDPDTKIDEQETQEVVESIKHQAFKDALDDIAEEIGVPADKLQEISAQINATYIDDVKVDSPIGFTGSDVSYKVFATFAPTLHINSMKEIADQLGLEIISIEVEPYVISRAMKGSRAKDYDAIFIDVGGGTTDVAVVSGGAIMGTKMFAYGGRVFTKRIAHDMELDLHEAEKMKLEYSADKLPDKIAAKVKKSLSKDALVWAEGVELALSEIEDVEKYPARIYLCGGGSALPEIRAALMEHPWLQVLPFNKYPKVDFLFPKQISDLVDETESIIDPEDIPPLALARMALEK